MKIRKANIKDLDGILELADLMLDYHYKMDKYYKIYSKYEDARKFYRDQIKDKKRHFMVAENEKKELVGFASGSIISIPKTKAPKIGNLIAIFVKKEYRRKKNGGELFEAMLKWLKDKNVKHVEMSVDARNKNGVNLWKKFGFQDYQLRLKMDL